MGQSLVVQNMPTGAEKFFHGQSVIALGRYVDSVEENTNYENEAVCYDMVLRAGFDALGQILNGSTADASEANTIKEIRDMRGRIVHTCVEQEGHFGFECDVCLPINWQFYDGICDFVDGLVAENNATPTGSMSMYATKTFIRPMLIVDETETEALLIYRALINSNIKMVDGMLVAHLSVKALSVDGYEVYGSFALLWWDGGSFIRTPFPNGSVPSAASLPEAGAK